MGILKWVELDSIFNPFNRGNAPFIRIKTFSDIIKSTNLLKDSGLLEFVDGVGLYRT
jgi:hypothetical protein